MFLSFPSRSSLIVSEARTREIRPFFDFALHLRLQGNRPASSPDHHVLKRYAVIFLLGQSGAAAGGEAESLPGYIFRPGRSAKARLIFKLTLLKGYKSPAV
jgi:hypothetical protein